MSDEDERMDRARRIRQMREGRRSTAPDEESTAETDDDPSTDTDAREAATDDQSDTTDQSVADRESDLAATESESDSTATDTEVSSVPIGTEPDQVAEDTSTSVDDASAAASSETTRPASESDEIDGPTGDEEWFDDAPADTNQPDSTDESGGAGAGGTADPEVTETAAAAASAAAAFEVDEAEQVQPTGESTTTDPETTSEEPEQEEEIRVLEFRLGDEHYCLDIEHVEEIVKEESVTRVPNTPEHVHGVVDLRGQITTILDPKIALDIAEDDGEQLIVVFGAETFEDQGHAGWIVDEVRQVLPITESEVKESPLDRQSIKGVIERDEEFVIWTTPDVALEEAED